MPERLRVWEFRGAELDLLVARAVGIQGARIVDGVCVLPDQRPFSPSADWAEGGPLLVQARISVWRYPDLDSWHACTHFDVVRDEGLKVKCYMQGPTLLVAAMRCYAASKLWEEAEQSAEVLGGA